MTFYVGLALLCSGMLVAGFAHVWLTSVPGKVENHIRGGGFTQTLTWNNGVNSPPESTITGWTKPEIYTRHRKESEWRQIRHLKFARIGGMVILVVGLATLIIANYLKNGG